MIPSVISKIISMQPSFTMSENEICQYVINNMEAVINSTISLVAKETGTSEASINRFCKKTGYKGFNGFKVALAQESFYSSLIKQNTIQEDETIINSVTQDYSNMLLTTSSMMIETDIIESIRHIKSANKIHVFGLLNSNVVAKELESKLTSIGFEAKCHIDFIDTMITISNIKSFDLAIFIAPNMLTKDIYTALSNCHDKGTKIIVIASYDSPKLNKVTDVKFITSDNITAKNSLSLSNNLMFLYVVDLIFSGLLKSDKTLRQKKLQSDTLINNYQMVDSYTIEYN